MNANEKLLLQMVCCGDLNQAQEQAGLILSKMTDVGNREFRKTAEATLAETLQRQSVQEPSGVPVSDEALQKKIDEEVAKRVDAIQKEMAIAAETQVRTEVESRVAKETEAINAAAEERIKQEVEARVEKELAERVPTVPAKKSTPEPVVNEERRKPKEKEKPQISPMMNGRAKGLDGLISIMDDKDFPLDKFILRENEKDLVRKVIAAQMCAKKLDQVGIPYAPSLLLHGHSGTGKTMLAHYIAYKVHLPFVYVKYSSVVSGEIGATQNNISRIFDFAEEFPCVLCLDEVDSIGMQRGEKENVGEMNRVVITLMQEIDRLRNDVILIGTTNRFDRLDPALARRFSIVSEVKQLTDVECKDLIMKFFKSLPASYRPKNDVIKGILKQYQWGQPAARVINTCTQAVVDKLTSEVNIDVSVFTEHVEFPKQEG